MNPIMNGSQSAWEMNMAEEKSLGEEHDFHESPAGGGFFDNPYPREGHFRDCQFRRILII